MPRAVLEIDATTAGIVAAFGQIRTQAQETERVVRASMGNLFAGIPAGSRRAQQSVYRDSQQITRDQERAAQASVRAFVRAEEQKRRAAQLTAEGRARAERQASEIARAEAWLIANPANAKRDGDRYLNLWLSRAQERAPRVSGNGPALAPVATREEIAERLPVTPNRIIKGGLFGGR